MLPAWLLITTFGVLIIDVGSRRREVSAPEVEKYGGGGGGGETNDSDDDRGRDGVVAGVATTTVEVLSKTLRGDKGEERLGFDFFL